MLRDGDRCVVSHALRGEGTLLAEALARFGLNAISARRLDARYRVWERRRRLAARSGRPRADHRAPAPRADPAPAPSRATSARQGRISCEDPRVGGGSANRTGGPDEPVARIRPEAADVPDARLGILGFAVQGRERAARGRRRDPHRVLDRLDPTRREGSIADVLRSRVVRVLPRMRAASRSSASSRSPISGVRQRADGRVGELARARSARRWLWQCQQQVELPRGIASRRGSRRRRCCTVRGQSTTNEVARLGQQREPIGAHPRHRSRPGGPARRPH